MTGIDLNTKKKKTKEKEESSIFAFLNKDIKLFGDNLSDKKKKDIYNDLYVLLSSGLDIKTVLEIIEEDVKPKERKLIIQIKENVLSGISLSKSLEKTGKFSPYEYYSLQIGEESGHLIEVLKDLSNYYDKKVEQKRKIVSAFSYPAIVFITAILAILFMLNYIVPMFQDVFKRFGDDDIPWLTKKVIDISKVFPYYVYFLIFIIITIIIISKIFKEEDWFRNISGKIALNMPFFSDIIRKIYITRLCLSMELLSSSKVPLIKSIQLMKKMIGFYPLEIALGEIEKDITNGMLLHESMKKFKIFDKRMISLIRVAEEVNKLTEVFKRLKDQYSEEVEHKTNMIGSVLEPFIIIFVGLFVAIILISMYLPMFQLSTSFMGH